MGVRMMCTECFRMEEPDTIIEGSDRKELLLWLCGLAPGFLYCYWRHQNRVKICPHCSSGELIREAKAARRKRLAREVAEPPSAPRTPRVFTSAKPGLLSRFAGTPGERLSWSSRAGTALAGSVALVLMVGINLIEVAPAPGTVPKELLQVPEEAAPAKIATDRSRQCRWVCEQFHEAGTVGLRDCVDTCVERRHEGADHRIALESCNAVMDPDTCQLVVGVDPFASGG
jgi:hypothetical protein